MAFQKRVGLVLGCGASRGWAHIGVIEALEEENIPIHLISGCSVGGYIGALYASKSLDSLKNFLLRMDGRKIFSYLDVVFPKSGLLDGTRRVRQLFSMHTDVKAFEDLDIPLVMVATDLDRGEKVVLNSGNLVTALRATMSYPGLFSPICINGRWLVDGGVVDPVPVGVARAMGAEVVIAVDLNSRIVSHSEPLGLMNNANNSATNRDDKSFSELREKIYKLYVNTEKKVWNSDNAISDQYHGSGTPPDIIETIMTSISTMQERITRINLAVDRPDILIQPRLGELKMMNFDRVPHTIEEGYLGTKEKIEDIKTFL